jgi:hypothetical protein
MKPIERLRNEALEVIKALRAGTMKPAEAESINNAIGKACQTLKIQLEYSSLRKEAPDIEFLNEPKR